MLFRSGAEITKIYNKEDGTEAEPFGGKITQIEFMGSSDNDLVTQKYTMASYNKDADNNKDVVSSGRLVAR